MDGSQNQVDDLYKRFKNKWLIKHLIDFESKGLPGVVEIHFDTGGRAKVVKPKPEIRE